jgi:hypothetical protein
VATIHNIVALTSAPASVRAHIPASLLTLGPLDTQSLMDDDSDELSDVPAEPETHVGVETDEGGRGKGKGIRGGRGGRGDRGGRGGKTGQQEVRQ